jgi:plastocyanin
MGTKSKYLHILVFAAFALSAAPDSSRRNIAATRNSSVAKSTSGAQADRPGEGVVSGTVRVAGPPVATTRVDMAADPACFKMHSGPVMSEEVVTGANGALKNVIVYISDGLGNRSFDAPKEAAVFEQKGCAYSPRVLGMQSRQTLELINNDPTSHNIHALPHNNREWNIFQPPGSSPTEETFAREEIIPVKCNVHPWMAGYIAVFKHPYFAITGKDGTFDLKNVPPGDYTIEAWHEKYGVLTQRVTLETDQTKTLEFVFKPQGVR